MAFHLVDDGTLDTVVRCTHCGEEIRSNFASSDYDGGEECELVDEDTAYDNFVDECIDDAFNTHECPKEGK
jgi:hypothetical protein